MRFVGKRVTQLVVVLLAVTFLSYLMLAKQQGDAALVKCALGCDEAQYQQVREELGLNRPIIVRYGDWLAHAVRGDLGESAIGNAAVSEALSQRLPVTIELVVLSQLISLIIAVPLGVYSARRPNGLLDRGSAAVGFVFLALPAFVVGLLLIELFAVKLRWFPATGYASFTENPAENIRDLFLPALTLSLAEIGIYTRILRTDLMSTLQEDYIMMAKAKGLSSRRVLWRHAFRPSTFSLITVAGLRIGGLIGGAIIIERVFTINGLGSYVVEAILKRDYEPLLAATVVLAVGYVLVNFAVDMFYAALDPRIRHARAIA